MFFWISDISTWQLGLIVGVLIFPVAAMGYPLRGEVSVGPADAFQLIFTSLMAR